MSRPDDFINRRKDIAGLSDEELHAKFWSLAQKIVEPLLEMAKTNTSPSIERSVLLRMGFSSLQTQAIVNKCSENNLLGKGAGNVVWALAKAKGMSVQEVGTALANGEHWEDAKSLFAGGQVK
ncbi:MAG TPA: ornithine aminomutase subunit alpha [Verrucomicrobiae bacterium]|nr:ornithine aminomutase subunit alpha [Verrucomicrobiae bacterium]